MKTIAMLEKEAKHLDNLEAIRTAAVAAIAALRDAGQDEEDDDYYAAVKGAASSLKMRISIDDQTMLGDMIEENDTEGLAKDRQAVVDAMAIRRLSLDQERLDAALETLQN